MFLMKGTVQQQGTDALDEGNSTAADFVICASEARVL